MDRFDSAQLKATDFQALFAGLGMLKSEPKYFIINFPKGVINKNDPIEIRGD